MVDHSTHNSGDQSQKMIQSWDPVEEYFQCITTCSLDDGECITRCVEELKESDT